MTTFVAHRPPLYDDILNPSHLSYRQRARLAEDKFSYNSLWRKAYIPHVVDRMLADAAARHEAAANSIPYQEGINASFNSIALSGFVTNTEKPVYSLTSFKTCLNPDLAPEPVSITHPRIAKRNFQRNKIDYMCTIRPDTETINQALRPLGTYATDIPHAKKTGSNIPSMTLGPQDMYWHPDVRLSDLSWATSTQVHDSCHPRDMFKATGQHRPASADPAYVGNRSRGVIPNTQQHQSLQQQLATARMTATQGQAQKQREHGQLGGDSNPAEIDGKQPGSSRPSIKSRPMSAGPAGYRGILPGGVPHDANMRSASRSSSASQRPQSAVPLSPMGCRTEQASGPGISGQWGAGGGVGAMPTTASAYPTTAMRPRPSTALPMRPAGAEEHSRTLRWAE